MAERSSRRWCTVSYTHLSPELTLRQIEEVAKDAPVELGVLLIGAQELMVTEHCMLCLLYTSRCV